MKEKEKEKSVLDLRSMVEHANRPRSLRLLALRKKIETQRAHLNELDKHLEELTKEQGGEHN